MRKIKEMYFRVLLEMNQSYSAIDGEEISKVLTERSIH